MFEEYIEARYEGGKEKSDDIANEKTFEKEVESLLKIKDAYPKILLARTRHEQYQYEGIQVIDIVEWLMR